MDYPRHHRSESGSALLTVIAVATFVSLTIAGIVLITNNRQKETALDDLRSMRDGVLKNITLQATTPEAIRFSAGRTGNTALRACISATGTCNAVGAANQRPFTLYMPHSAGSAAAQPAVASGTTPIRYTSRGARDACTPGPLCPFQAEVYFWGEGCQAGKGCGRIKVRPIVRVGGAIKFKGGFTLQSRPIAKDFDTAKSKFAFELQTPEIRGAYMQDCLTGSFLVGLTKGTASNPGGHIICKCMPGFKETGKDPQLGLPVCTPTNCGAGTVFVGFDAKNAPMCVKLQEKDYKCTTEKVAAHGKVSCKPGAKLRAAQTKGDCYLVGKDKIPACPKKECVQCPQMELTCCAAN